MKKSKSTYSETTYLLSSKENKKRLLESIQECKQGKTIPFILGDESTK